MPWGKPLADFRTGVRLGVDWGKVRIGVAACDADGLLSYPVETVPAANEPEAIERVAGLAADYHAIEVVMGLPIALNGQTGLAATDVVAVAARLANRLNVPLRLLDERLTTAAASRHLTGLHSRSRRRVVDQAAAVGLLDNAITYERHTGHPAGVVCETGSGQQTTSACGMTGSGN
jgi:putative Holliday junction resolvase